jgi:hypothetical protein
MKTLVAVSLLGSLLMAVPAFSADKIVTNYADFLTTYPNQARQAYIAGNAFFESEEDYSSLLSVPIGKDDAREFTLQALTETCKKEMGTAVDPSSLHFEFKQGLGVVARRDIFMNASAKCLQYGADDPAMVAIKNNEPGLFHREDQMYLNQLPSTLTARIGFYSINESGEVTQLQGSQLPQFDISYEWYSGNLVQEAENKASKVQSVQPKLVETDAHGNSYFKLNLAPIQAQNNSFTTDEHMVFTVNGSSFALDEFNLTGNMVSLLGHAGVWDTDPSAFKKYFKNGLFPLCRVNEEVGVLDCKVYIK